MTKLPEPSPMIEHWPLDRGVCFLNHGSFGACPTALLEAQHRHQLSIEREPVRFYVEDYEHRIDAARKALAEFVGCAPDDLALVPNATTGVNTVLRSLDLKPGDEILSNTQEYPACRYAARAIAERRGARVVSAELPFPVHAEDQVVEAIVSRVTSRTRVALVSHVTSQTGLVLPVTRIVRELAERGVDTLVDGAHAPGMLDLRIDEIGAAFYTGNCHKWMCTPKGAALLHVRKDRQAMIRPLVLSHGVGLGGQTGRFYREFVFAGTSDVSPWLTIPDAIQYFEDLVPGGWAEIRRRNRELALAGRRLLCEALGIEPPAPDAMIANLVSVPLPDRRPGEELPPGVGMLQSTLDPLYFALRERYRIQIPVIPFPAGTPGRLIRFAAQLYVSLEQIEYLAWALRRELGLS